jgi:hypothetical protein
VLAVTVLPGCFPVDEQAVLIAGHDERGTLVVGSAACDSEGVRPGGSIWVWDPNSRVDDGDLWGIEWEASAVVDDVAFEPPRPPPAAEPDVLAGVPMVAVGAPDPANANVVYALEDPLPDGPFSVEAFGFSTDSPPLSALTIEVEGPPDTYQAALGEERRVFDLDAAGLAELVSDHCADDGSDAVRAGVITGLVSLVVVGLALAGGLWAAVRQYKRAGATHALRRAGLPPEG